MKQLAWEKLLEQYASTNGDSMDDAEAMERRAKAADAAGMPELARQFRNLAATARYKRVMR